MRIEYYDFIRGVAIIMVVGIHTFVASPIETPLDFGVLCVRQLLNCAVPIFLTISGFFCGNKVLINKNDRIRFWSKQIPKVYIPALIWSLPYFVRSIVGGELFIDIVRLLVCGFSIYYFVALIVQYYLLLPILQSNKSIMLPISFVVSTLAILLITYITQIQGVELPLIVYAGPFTTWFVFFMLGVYLSSSDMKCSVTWAIILALLGFVLECVETYYLNTRTCGGYGIKLSSFIYSIGIMMIVFNPKVIYKSNKFTSVIAHIGRISFGVYLIHCFVISVLNAIIPDLVWFLSWLLVLVMTSIIVIVARKVLPYKINKYLGFS